MIRVPMRERQRGISERKAKGNFRQERKDICGHEGREKGEGPLLICGHEGRAWSDADTAKDSWSHQTPGDAKNRCSLEPSQEIWPYGPFISDL